MITKVVGKNRVRPVFFGSYKLKKIGAVVLLALILLVAVLLKPKSEPDIRSVSTHDQVNSLELSVESQSDQPKNTLVTQLASYFKKRYGPSIQSIITQASLLSELDRLEKTQPEHSRELFDESVSMAFPYQSKQILSVIDLLIVYEKWLDANTAQLNRLEPGAQLATLWEKRYELFGEDAEVLWADNALGSDAKQAQIQAEMNQLAQVTDQPAGRIADQLLTKIDEVYADSVAAALLTPEDLEQAIFAMDSVQADLAALDQEARARTIDELRRKVGHSEEAIDQLAQRDQRNQQKWDTGYQYQAAKKLLLEQYTGARYEQELSDLQLELFGNSAATIAAEERSGFYRFDRPRLYGVN